ncbi:ATP-dependent endonuclease, partial [Salmonella enterica]|nr:ATP-dependent endonuclease [Salmonella enterica]
LELARLLENRVAALRDNDGNYQQNCDERYADVICSRSRVFADRDNTRSTFEISLYQDNADLCDTLFRGPRRTLTVQEYMLANKAEAAFRLLQLHAGELTVPDYIQEALAWIRE